VSSTTTLSNNLRFNIETMVRNQDDASFLTWTATLHPESATTTMGPSARQSNRNPLEVVYYEISSDDVYFDGLPIAVQVVAVDDDNDNGDHIHQNCSGLHRQTERTATLPVEDPDSNLSEPAAAAIYRPKPWRYSNAIDLVLGFMLALVTWITTLKLELTAFIVYALAAGFYFLSEKVFGGSPVTILFKSIFGILTAVLMIVDAVILMVNVLVTEILGAVALFLCTFFGGQRSGTEWHL
jgi:hypothetical protein